MTEHTPDAHVDAALRTLREQTSSLETPRAVEDALLAAFAQQQRRQGQQQHHEKKVRWFDRLAMPRWGTGMGLAGLGAAVLAAILLLAVPPEHPLPATGVLHASADDGGDFIALASAEHIALEPRPQLIETDVARTALASLGVPLSPDNAGDLVRAQILVGADGEALALRLLAATPPFHHSPDRG